MKNQLLRKAIEEFKNKRLGVYKADPDQIVRDTHVAERATKDHVGRWLFELLQNSDDAKASQVRIIIDNNTLYVADDGHGLKPEAVAAICSTDFSDKTTGTIGHKGVGFKSVYEVSQNPQVLTVNGEGIEFSREKTEAWLRENNLNEGHVPYQWVPFSIPWDDAQQQDPHLSDFKAKAFKTVVRLPGLLGKKQKVEQLLKKWPPHALFTFRHLRKITAPGLEVDLSDEGDVWLLHDSRGQAPVEWRVSRHTEHPPDDLLEMLGDEERQAISTDGVSFLIAAPLENDCVVPTSDYLPIHVFYPTEQKGPVRLLLHAEFLVKSDRTALMPVDGNPFNAWVAERLACHVCKFVNDSYCPEAPRSHAALLVPFKDRTSHPVAGNLWRCVADEAKKCLRLGDVEGCQRLSIEEARLVSVSVRSDLARTLLEATRYRGQLLHASFDNNKEAHKALKELGCKKIDDQDLMAAIEENADPLASDTQWVWACWEWLAAWVAEEPYGEEHRERIKRAKALPVVPIDGGLAKASDLADRIVTWKPDADVGNLPDWLPLAFVADWFRDKIRNEPEDSPVRKLSEKLGIDEPGADVIQRAVGRAIEQYWKDKQGDPGRFLNFILEQDWHEASEATEALQRCPVPLTKPIQGEAWAEAGKAYLGREWGCDLLEDLHQGRDNIAWVQNIGGERECSILEWLGCVAYPRIIKDRGPEGNGIGADDLPDECHAWRTQEFGDTDRTPTVDGISRLEALTIEELSGTQVRSLLVLLAKHWKEYYRGHSEATLSWFYYTGRSRIVPAFWWFQILHDIRPAMTTVSVPPALSDCWLPDKRTKQTIGDLLPVVDLDAFGDDKGVVGDWLINVVNLRTRTEQLTVDEWKELLSNRIPDRAAIERLMPDERLRDKVTGWYTVCLETVAEQEGVSQKAFAACPLLCRKGNVWQYVADGPRYLNDDNDLAMAFAEDVWLFHIRAGLAADAVRYFGVLRLSQSVEVNVTPGEPQLSLPDKLKEKFRASLPYVWAWRSSQSKQAADGLWGRLKGLEVLVVPTLKASLSLDGLRRQVEKRWHVDNDTIYLHESHVNEAELAQALAKAHDVRSDADFYENLLRCTDDRQRKEKLLSKGMADAEIDRCLREYSRSPTEEEHDEGPGEPIKGEQGRSQGQKPKQSPPKPPGDTPEEASPGHPESGEQPLRLKDPETTPYVLGSPPSGRAGPGGSGEMREGRSLTDAEKAELEGAGRTFAARELKKMGFSVEEMPRDNPGFDLRAKKGGDELRVEVKAHSGRATVVDVTHREYKEYLGQQGYRWELWNVEHLADNDSDQVVITQYNKIPEEALDTRIFRVDLKKCQRKLQD